MARGVFGRPLLAMRGAAELGFPARRIDLETCQEAQDSPCVCGVCGIFLDGELLGGHPVGKDEILRHGGSRITSCSM